LKDWKTERKVGGPESRSESVRVGVVIFGKMEKGDNQEFGEECASVGDGGGGGDGDGDGDE